MNRFRRVLIVIGILASFFSPVSAQAVSANPSPVCSGTTCTVTFTYTGDYYQWTAPVTGTFTLEVWGAQGGNAAYANSVITYGGKGGYAKGSRTLTSGQTLYIYVGGQGAGGGTANNDKMLGGFNGGGFGYNGNNSTNRGAGGGGGTDIRVGSDTLVARAIVAGGGAGGTYYPSYGPNFPGVGGGLNGGTGAVTNYNSLQYQGQGGTQTYGGPGGTNGSTGTAGNLGVGGNGGGPYGLSEGGGGGGYYGGGAAGTGMASGGGSGYVGSLNTTTLTAGDASMPNPSGGTMTGNTGNGFARIAYTYTAPTISLTSAGNATSASKGVGIVLTAAINSTGFVTFYANNKRIPKCINLAASSGNKTCTWVPTGVKNAQVYATFSQSGSVVATSTSISFALAKRIGLR